MTASHRDFSGDEGDLVQVKMDAVRQAAEAAVNYIAAERHGTVTPTSADEITEALLHFDLDDPKPPSDVVAALADFGSAHTVRSTGGRYFGFVTGGTEAAALAATVLASAWDQNAALPIMSPLAGAIDARCTAQIIDVLQLPNSATAAFCAGASVANLTAVMCARDALLSAVGWDVAELGLNGAPSLRIVMSDEAHVSVDKALRLAGIGRRSIVRAPSMTSVALIRSVCPVLTGQRSLWLRPATSIPATAVPSPPFWNESLPTDGWRIMRPMAPHRMSTEPSAPLFRRGPRPVRGQAGRPERTGRTPSEYGSGTSPLDRSPHRQAQCRPAFVGDQRAEIDQMVGRLRAAIAGPASSNPCRPSAVGCRWMRLAAGCSSRFLTADR